MKPVVLILLLVMLFFTACGPSARFRSGEKRIPPNNDSPENSPSHTNLDQFVENWLHVPYRYGGMSKSGIDCSGLTKLAMRQLYRIEIPRTAADQFSKGDRIRSGEWLTGDLLFFKNIRGTGVDHVGLYLGNNRFVHATESSGVTISELSESYYQERFAGACRYGH